MNVTSITARMQSERKEIPAQAKLTPTESAELNVFVEYWRDHGIPDATRSSAIRALILDGLEAFQEFREKEKAAEQDASQKSPQAIGAP